MVTPPSAEFTTAANAADREPKIRIPVLFTDPFVQSGNIVASDDVNNFCDLDSEVVDDLLLHTADTRLETPYKYIINDGTWINDGTFYPVPGTIEEAAYNQVGWYTSGTSDSSGDFGTPQEMVITFAEARTINELIVVGEPTLGEYPTDFDVEIYDSDDVLLNPTTNFTGTSVETYLDFVSDNITTAKYMKLILNSWSVENTIGKIVEFFGVITKTLYGSDIISADILEELESESDDSSSPYGVMSCNELNVELQNVKIAINGTEYDDPFLPENTSSPYCNSATQNVRFSPEIGFRLPDMSIEYVAMGVFWSLDWDVSEGQFPASVTARDRLYILSKNTFQADEILEGTDLKEFAEYVLNHAKVNVPLNDLEWDIDSSLSSFPIDYAWIGKVTYFEALRLIASACMGRCYCSRDDKVVIESYSSDETTSSSDITVAHSMCFKKKRLMKEIKNKIIVPVCQLIPEVEDGDIYISDDVEVGAGVTDIIEEISWKDDAVYEFSDVIIDSTDVTILKTGSVYYPHGAVLTFTKVSGSSGSFNYKVIGKKLIPVTGIEDETAEDDEGKLRKYGTHEFTLEENYLLQSSAAASGIANALLESLKDNRRDIDIEIQGNPCYECGDHADIETYSKTSLYEEFRLIKNQYKIDSSGLRVNCTAKKLVDLGV